MTLPMPPNGDEAAFLAFVMVDELVDLLVGKGAISNADADYFYAEVAERLGKGSGPLSKRASKFIADWIERNPHAE
jgi:hypothetical protein